MQFLEPPAFDLLVRSDQIGMLRPEAEEPTSIQRLRMSKTNKRTSNAGGSAAASPSEAVPQLSTYRVLALQPLSVNLAPQTIDLKIPQLPRQLQEGDSLLANEFADKGDEDLFVAARKGRSRSHPLQRAHCLAVTLTSTTWRFPARGR